MIVKNYTNRFRTSVLALATLWAINDVDAQTRPRYRTYDGTLNNVSVTTRNTWGAAGNPLFRELPAEYGPTDPKNALGGTTRPTPRLISNVLSNEPQDVQNERNLSGLTYIWGQFLDHDITLSPGGTEAAPIALPTNEPLFTRPISFTRTAAHPGTGVTNPREQTNLQTSWVDASQVYGADAATARWLRTFRDGKLKVSLGNMLPFNTITGEFDSPIDPTAPKMDDDNNRTKKTFAAGDPRAAEHPGLTSLHTIFVREHNRICDRLKGQGLVSDEEIYQRARKEVGALMQVITYGQWLTALGVQLKPYLGYNANVRPDILNTFSTAAYRWHTMVENDIIFRDNNCFGVGPVELPLKDVFFNINIVRTYGIDVMLKGLSVHQQYETDLKVNNGLRNFLFGPGSGLDLVSLNIQRGRDHGLPHYNKVRQHYTGLPAYTFNDIASHDTIAQKMQALYGNVNNVDLWVGLYAEPRLPGKSVGRTVDAILRNQLESLRDGDFYYFLNDPDLIAMRATLQATTLGDIIARNTTAGNFQANVFFRKLCDANGDDIAKTPCDANNPTYVGWTFLGKQGKNRYYKWTSAAALSHADAALKAETLGGTLPKITNAAENTYLLSIAAGANVWLDLQKNGTAWVHSDGTQAAYFNWKVGQPNNLGGLETRAILSADGKWDDVQPTLTNVVIAAVPCLDACDLDATAPVFAKCPTNINVSFGLLSLCKQVTWTAPTATDNCGVVSMTQTAGLPSGSCFLPGVHTMAYTAVDAKGNKSTCSFTITAIKTLLPLFLDNKETLVMEASAEPRRALIEWVNNTGYKNDFFAVERMNATTGEFETLEMVNSKSKKDETMYYTVYDNAPNDGDNIYRIRVVHVDGSVRYSDNKTVNFKGMAEVNVFPNPANDVLNVDISNYKGVEAVEIQLYNQLGQLVLSQKVNGNGVRPIVELNVDNQQTGTYLIRVTSKGKRDVTKLVNIAH